jgi:hypothetical protein
MKRAILGYLVVGSAVALPGASLASLNLELDLADQFVVAPGVGTFGVVYSGTITVSATETISSAIVEWPGNGVNTLFTDFHADFVSFMGSNGAGDSYVGNIFTVSVTPTDVGLYDLNATGPSGLAEISVYATRAGKPDSFDSEIFSLDVTPVPEPATLAILAIGAMALRRRK